jgi:hypothetical protein
MTQPRLIIGVLLIALGLWVASGRAIYRSKQEVLRIGTLKAAVDEDHTLPQWTGWVAVGVGAVLLYMAGRKRA